MTTQDTAVTAVQDHLGRYRRTEVRYRGYLGDGNGEVMVPGREGYVYVRRRDTQLAADQTPMEIRHTSAEVPTIDGFPVIVGVDLNLDELRVLAVDTDQEMDWVREDRIRGHHRQHEMRDGYDVVWIQKQAIVPMLVRPNYPTANWTIYVQDDYYPWRHDWIHFLGEWSDDFSGYVPGIANRAIFILLYVDCDTNTLGYLVGDEFAVGVLDPSIYIPNIPNDTVPLAALYLPWNATAIEWENIFDLRMFNQPYGTTFSWEDEADQGGSDMDHDHSDPGQGGSELHDLTALQFNAAVPVSLSAGAFSANSYEILIPINVSLTANELTSERCEIILPSGITIPVWDMTMSTLSGDNYTTIVLPSGYELTASTVDDDTCIFELSTDAEITSGNMITGNNIYYCLLPETWSMTSDTPPSGDITLSEIYGGVEGDLLLIRPPSADLNITVQHSAGDIWLFNVQNITLSGDHDHLFFVFDGDYWCNIGGVDDHSANLYLNDLLDVNALAPADDDSLTWDAATGMWIPIAVPTLPPCAGAGFAIVSTGVNTYAASLTPTWLGQHTFNAGWILSGGLADLNGLVDALVLDLDGDTTISSPVDDQIDFEISGADDFVMVANEFQVLAGSHILMADDTWIRTGVPGAGFVFDSTPFIEEITIVDAFLVFENAGETGLAAAGGRIHFNSTPVPDEITFLDCHVGIGRVAPGNTLLEVYDVTVDTTATYYGIYNEHIKTVGVTDAADDMFGIYSRFEFDHTGSTFGKLYGAYIEAELSDGTSGGGDDIWGAYVYANLDGGIASNDVWGLQAEVRGAGTVVTYDIWGIDSWVDLNTGQVGRDVFALSSWTDIAVGFTSVGGDVYGLYIYMDDNLGVTGDVYMIYLDEKDGVDYGIYQSGTALHVWGGSHQVADDTYVGFTGGGRIVYDSTPAPNTVNFVACESHWDNYRDVYPDNAGRGIWARYVNRFSLTTYDWHFRVGDPGPPTGYAWQGAPFVAAGALNYARANDYMMAVSGGAGQRSFMSIAVANNAGAWLDKSIYARIRTGSTTQVGVRFDDGTDNNYAEILTTGAAADATQNIIFVTRIGGGAVNTVVSNLVIPVDNFITVRLYCRFLAPNYWAYGYIIAEDGEGVNITGFIVNMGAGGFPAAGRVGVIYKDLGNYAAVDWIYENFG